MRLSSTLAASGLLLATLGPSFAAAGGGPSGVWTVQEGNATVRVSKCGSGYCGFVASGEPGKDYRNPDPRKRNRPVVGIQVLFGMKQSGPNSWSGETYNAEDGQMYMGKITLSSPTTLTIDGCAQGGAPCGSQTWTRAR